MSRRVELLRQPVVYDIVVGDFGRDAAATYFQLVAKLERESIVSFLLPDGGVHFFDEYRRIMSCLISDVEYVKRSYIREAAERDGTDDSILVGVRGTPITRPSWSGSH